MLIKKIQKKLKQSTYRSRRSFIKAGVPPPCLIPEIKSGQFLLFLKIVLFLSGGGMFVCLFFSLTFFNLAADSLLYLNGFVWDSIFVWFYCICLFTFSPMIQASWFIFLFFFWQIQILFQACARVLEVDQ